MRVALPQEARAIRRGDVLLMAAEPGKPTAELDGNAGGGLPVYRACQQKVARTWHTLQRHVYRRAAAVDAHDLPDRPRLLAAAEDRKPSQWGREVVRWPEVARASSRAGARSPGASVSQMTSLELDGLMPQASTRSVWESSIYSGFAGPSEMTALASTMLPSYSESFEPGGGLRTPPYARSFAPAPSVALDEGLIQALTSAATDENERGEAAAKALLEVETGGRSHREEMMRQRAHRLSPDSWSVSMSQRPPPWEQCVEKLRYLRDCRTVMGEDRYGLERRRLELQSDVKSAFKYTLELDGGGVTSRPRSASPDSRSARLPGSPSPGPSVLEPRKPATSRDMPQLGPRMTALAAVAAASAANAATAGNIENTAAASVRAALETIPHRSAVVAALEFGRLCKERKVATPTLGSFALEGSTAGGNRVPRSAHRTPLSVGHWSLGDAPLLALAASPLRSSLEKLEHCVLRGNRLSNAGVVAVAESLGPDTTTVDLAANAFDHRGAEALRAFLSRGAPHLRELDLSSNHLGDQAVAAICRELPNSCPDLEQLLLADVQVGFGLHTGAALGKFLTMSRRLTVLDVSYNMLQGEGAACLLDGVHENGLPNSTGRRSLRHLDLSWNCLGQDHGRSQVTSKLASVLCDCSSLVHLDISFNRLCAEDCTALSASLRTNHTLWGLHVDGNAAIVDADGFLRVLDDVGPDAFASNVPVLPAVIDKPKKASGRKSKRSARRGKKHHGAHAVSEEEALHEARMQKLSKETSSIMASELWLRDKVVKSEVVADLWKKQHFGLELPEPLKENPGNHAVEYPTWVKVPDGTPVSTRTLPPRVLDEWLQSLSWQIPEELRDPYFDSPEPDSTTAALLPASARSPPPHLEATRRARRRRRERRAQLAQLVPGRHGTAPSCWLCEGWVEVHFMLTPSISSSEALVRARRACAFVSVDNFARPVVLHRTECGRFRGSRFLPPLAEPTLVVFQVDERLEVALDLPRRRMGRALRIALYGVQESVEASGGAVAADAGGQPAVGTISEANVLFVDQLAAARHLRALASGEAPSLGELPEELLRSKAVPRLSLFDGDADQAAPAPPPPRWALAGSVWAKHSHLYDDSISAALAAGFDFDWRLACAKLRRSFPADAPALEDLRKALQPQHPLLSRLYQSLATVSIADSSGLGITLGAFTRLMKDSGLLDAHQDHGSTREDFDAVFVACKQRPPWEALGNAREAVVATSKQRLVRWQFLEMVVRLGDALRGRGGSRSTAGAGAETLSQASLRIWRRHLLPLARAADAAVKTFRSTALSEAADQVFRRWLPQLLRAFRFFSRVPTMEALPSESEEKEDDDGEELSNRVAFEPGCDITEVMTCNGWCGFLSELGLMEEDGRSCATTGILEGRAALAFNSGAAINPREATSARPAELRFVDFLLALSHLLFTQPPRKEEEVPLLLDDDEEEQRSKEPSFAEVAAGLLEARLPALDRRLRTWRGWPLLGRLRQVNGGVVPAASGANLAWFGEMERVLQRLCGTDDILDQEVSLRELELTFNQPAALQELSKLGIDFAHVGDFIDTAAGGRRGGVNRLTLVEALMSLAAVKRRLHSRQPAFHFFGLLLGKRTKEEVEESEAPAEDMGEAAPRAAHVGANLVLDYSQKIPRKDFEYAREHPVVRAYLQYLGLNFDLLHFWDFLVARHYGASAGATGEGPVRLGGLLHGFVAFTDWRRSAAEAAGFLRETLRLLDTEGGGRLSVLEYLALLEDQKLRDTMRGLQLQDGERSQEVVEASLRFSCRQLSREAQPGVILAIDEVIGNFQEHLQMSQQRLLENDRLQKAEPPPHPREPVPNLAAVPTEKRVEDVPAEEPQAVAPASPSAPKRASVELPAAAAATGSTGTAGFRAAAGGNGGRHPGSSPRGARASLLPVAPPKRPPTAPGGGGSRAGGGAARPSNVGGASLRGRRTRLPFTRTGGSMVASQRRH